MIKRVAILTVLILAFTSCGGGGGGGDELATDACSSIGLPTKSARIVNGTACGNLSSSAVVRIAVFNRSGDALGFCSGTMLTSGAALTAAHCIVSGTAAASVIYGDPGSTKSVFAKNIYVHPDYVPSSIFSPNFSAFNDVAIIELNGTVPVPTMPLLKSKVIGGGDVISIFGYGTDENGNFDFRDLKSGQMEVNDVTENHITAIFNGEGSNTCQGDSGGPAFSDAGGPIAIAGITSSGTIQDCSEGDNSVFINVSSDSVISFIQRIVPGARTI